MSGTKTRVGFGLTGKVETTYLTRNAPAVGTDGIPVIEYPEFTIDYGVDGMRGPAPGSGGILAPTAPAAPVVTGQVKVENRGAGAAYSAAVFSREHNLLRASGFDATGAFGAGTEKFTYTPTAGSTGYTSLSIDVYTDQEIIQVVGAYCDATFEIENGKPGIWTFDVKGRLNAVPTDDSGGTVMKTIVYGTVMPHTADPLALTINGVSTLVVEKFTFKMGRDLHERVKGRQGYHPGRRNPTISFLVEKELLSTINFENLRNAGTAFAVSGTFGSTQYFRDKPSFPQVKITGIKPHGDGARSLYEVTCACYPSTLTANDDVSWVKD